MAVYSGTPTVVGAWEEGDRNGRLVRVRKLLTIALSSQGGATNYVSAVSLGFRAGSLQGARCVLFVASSVNRVVWLFTDGTYVFVADPTQATDANRGIAADVTGTLTFEVWGIPV